MADGKEKDAEHASLAASHNASSSNGNGAPGQPRRLVAPEIIRVMTPEHRLKVEKRLKRKIDLRLLPAIVLMYILNYIDRYATFPPPPPPLARWPRAVKESERRGRLRAGSGTTSPPPRLLA